MKNLIERSRYLSLIAVVTLLLTFALALLWGVGSAVVVWREIIVSLGQSSKIILLLIKLVDIFLIAITLYLLAASIYRIFIGPISLPSQIVAENLTELKSKLSSLIVLVIVVRFMESLFGESEKPIDLMWLAIATALVAGALIAFGYFGQKNGKAVE